MTDVLLLVTVMAIGGVSAALLGRGRRGPQSFWFGQSVIDGVAFVAITASTLLALRSLLQPTPLNDFLVAFFVALLPVRLVFFLIHAAIGRKISNLTAALISGFAALLWSQGWLPAILFNLEQVRWSYGHGAVTLLQALKALASVALALILILWVAELFERELQKRVLAQHQHLARAMGRFVRVALLFLAGVMVLPLVGIDSTVFATLSGGAAIGLGLALRHVTSSLASGYILLAERTVREGDLVRIGSTEGRVVEINPRYLVVRSGSGSTLLPNHLVVDSRLENLTLSDRRNLLNSTLRLEQNAPIDALREQIPIALAETKGVCASPAPSVHVSGSTGGIIEMTIEFWTDTPEAGAAIRSEVNFTILKLLRAAGVRPARSSRVLQGVAPASEPWRYNR